KESIEKYLEKKALAGWMLEKADELRWVFKKCEPMTVRFSVNYFPNASAFAPGPTERQEQYYELCSRCGWGLVASNAQLQIFATTNEDATPIETDPVVEVQTIHKAVKKAYYPIWIVWMVLCVVQLLLCGLNFHTDPKSFLITNMDPANFVFMLSSLVIFASQFCGYLSWHKKAKRAAEERGVFLSAKGGNVAPIIAALFLFVMLLLVILTGPMSSTRLSAIFIAVVIEIALLLVITLAVHRFMKRKNVPAKINLAITVVTSAVLSVLLTGLTVIMAVVFTLSVDSVVKNPPEPPITMSDIGGLVTEEIRNEVYTYESAFTETYEFVQYYDDTEGVEFSYTETRVKLDGMYGFLKNSTLEDINHLGKTSEHYEEIDGDLWGADSAYMLYDGDKPTGDHVLCYEDKIVEIYFSWEVTKEHKAAVGEAFD
ncbi:MAG: DUF2812 domain-containing protein, partial [Clostridia bacterium]|nr:DUF2812 domain-containing protein [Clostridia bacterium]